MEVQFACHIEKIARCIKPFVQNAARNAKSPSNPTQTDLSIVANAIATRDRRDDPDDIRLTRVV